jgi:hypothetical protein
MSTESVGQYEREVPSEQVREYTTAVLNEYRGVWTNPDFISSKHVAKAIQQLTFHATDLNTNRHIHTGNYSADLELITDHPDMPPKVEWAARIHIDGVASPLWASYTPDYGLSIKHHSLYWIGDSYTAPVSDEPTDTE